MTKLMKLSLELNSNISNLEQMVFIVQDSESREMVVAATRKAKSIKALVVAFFKESKEHADKAHKAICANEKTFTERCDVVEERGKDEVIRWDDEQKAIREKERARLQAIADEEARRERERLEKRAAKLKTPEKIEALLDEAESIIAPVVQVEEQEKTEGISTRKIWKAKVFDIGSVPREWMIVNEKALDAFARSTKGSVKVAGVDFYQESSLAVKI